MSTDLAVGLEERGIRLKRHQPGEHRARYPERDRARRDDALAVRIDGDRAAWLCHRCAWSGRIRTGRVAIPVRLLGAKTQREERQPEPAPQRYETLAPWGLDFWDGGRPITPGSIAATHLAQRAVVWCRLAICAGTRLCSIASTAIAAWRRNRSTSAKPNIAAQIVRASILDLLEDAAFVGMADGRKAPLYERSK